MRNILGTLLIGLLVLSACIGPRDESGATLNPGDSIRLQLEALSKKISEDGDNAELYHLRARIYLARRDFDLALKDIRAAISIDPRQPAYYVSLSDVYLLTGQPENSKDALIKALELDPRQTDAMLKLAKLYLIIKDYPACFEEVKTLLTIDPGNSGAYYTRAIALLEKGDTVMAVQDLQKAVENDQEFYDGYIQLGELYAIKKDPLAELYIKNALNIRPLSKEALYMLGMFYQETQKFDKAISTYEILRKADSSFREAPYNIGYIYLVYLHDYKRAIDYFSEAILRDPAFYRAYYNRGYAWELAGNFDKAREDYQKTLKVEVNYDKAIEGLNRLDRIR